MNPKKRIGILHAYPSVFLVESLHKAGYAVVVIGNTDQIAGHAGLEGAVSVPLWDSAAVREAVLAYHAERPFDAFLPVNEGTIIQTASLSGELGLRALTLQAAVSSRNKLISNLLWGAQGIPVPPAFPVYDAGSAWRVVESHLGGYGILKLVDSMNSQGVVAVGSPSECSEAIERLVNMTRQSVSMDLKLDRNRFAYGRSNLKLMAQAYCEGVEVGVDVFLMPDGHDRILALLEKVPSKGPYFAETASFCPTSLTADEEARVGAIAIQAARGLGLAEGPAHVEIRFKAGQPMVLEAGLRPGGGYTVQVIQRLTGENVFESQARLATGQTVFSRGAQERRAILFGGITFERSGWLRRVTGMEVFEGLAQLEELVTLCGVGDWVKAMPESAQPHFCYYILSGENRDELLEVHHRIGREVKLEIDEETTHAL